MTPRIPGSTRPGDERHGQRPVGRDRIPTPRRSPRPLPPARSTGKLPAGLEPGAVVDAPLDLVAPTVPGEYLLLLDVMTPDHGSIVATGVEPTIIRVTVAAPKAAE